MASSVTPAVGAVLALVLASTLPGQAQEPSLWLVLVRATHYVEDLHAQLSGVVMEERYQQLASVPPARRRIGEATVVRMTLRSDYLVPARKPPFRAEF